MIVAEPMDLEKMAEDVDIIRLVDRVIAKMPRIPPWLRDEAKSQAMLDITRSMRAFKPEKGVPLAAFLARDLHFCILNWQLKEYRRNHPEIPPNTAAPESGIERTHRTERFTEVIRTARICLSRVEYMAVVGAAVGFTADELCRSLRLNKVALARTQEAARKKLLEAMRDGTPT